MTLCSKKNKLGPLRRPHRQQINDDYTNKSSFKSEPQISSKSYNISFLDRLFTTALVCRCNYDVFFFKPRLHCQQMDCFPSRLTRDDPLGWRRWSCCSPRGSYWHYWRSVRPDSVQKIVHLYYEHLHYVQTIEIANEIQTIASCAARHSWMNTANAKG